MRNEDFSNGAPVPTPHDWLAAGQESAVDCETAMWLRAILAPIFRSARNWPELSRALHDKGYDLIFHEARLVMVDRLTGRHICTTRFLGAALADLSMRLGKPNVVTDGATDGHLRY